MYNKQHNITLDNPENGHTIFPSGENPTATQAILGSPVVIFAAIENVTSLVSLVQLMR